MRQVLSTVRAPSPSDTGAGCKSTPTTEDPLSLLRSKRLELKILSISYTNTFHSRG